MLNDKGSNSAMTGRIHSFESASFVDGPGTRCVIFFQGCPLRCVYCHNPDTWDFSQGTLADAAELIDRVKRFKPYFRRNSGGLTCSGGEPLQQPEFLLELLSRARREGIHTAVDTSGFGRGMYGNILALTDLVLLDIKHVDAEGIRGICGVENLQPMHDFEEALRQSGVKLWIRHVVIPGMTDGVEHLRRVHEKARSFKNLERIELLPYHSMGEIKYRYLGIPYPLEGVRSMGCSEIDRLAD